MHRLVLPLSSIVVIFAAWTVCAAGAEPIATIRGGGAFGDRGGIYENHQPYFDHVSVSAALYADGTAGGTIVWTSEWNAYFDPNPDNYAKQWLIRVDGWYLLEDGSVGLTGVVVHSSLKSDPEWWVGIPFFDGGPGNADLIMGYEIDGNIVIAGQ